MFPIGIALGQSVGGILISLFGWHSVFYFNVPIGIIGVVLALRFLNICVSEHIKKFDILGVFMLAGLLLCYDFAVTFAESDGASNSFIINKEDYHRDF